MMIGGRGRKERKTPAGDGDAGDAGDGDAGDADDGDDERWCLEEGFQREED